MGNFGNGVAEYPLNWTHHNHQRIGVAVADSPDGPWQRFDKPVVDVGVDADAPDALMTSNPAVTPRPEGGVLMVYKAVGKKRPGRAPGRDRRLSDRPIQESAGRDIWGERRDVRG